MTFVADALFFLVRVALALILACGLVALGIYAAATQAKRVIQMPSR